MELSGEPAQLAQGLLGGPRAFSASMTGVLAYRAGGYAEYDRTITQLTWVDRGGAVLGIAGVILAVPILAAFKIFCTHIKQMEPVAEFLS